MKHKLKKWHIALMSFLTLFIAVFASLFSLKADTVDDETGEVLTDNWELGVVFYDSTVDNGTTPLTEINWDASDGGYKDGTSRVITVQINYKNDSAVTTYQPGELEICIPNLIYYKYEQEDTAYSAKWSTSVIVGANDATHTGYEWNFASGKTPSSDQEMFIFANAKTIEEKSNFEGSIQIKYTITPDEEYPEGYLEECIHTYVKTLQATLKILKEAQTVTSPNWPNNYPNSMSTTNNYWEYTSQISENLVVKFSLDSEVEKDDDYIYIYDEIGFKYRLTGTEMAGGAYHVTGNYVKISMYSDSRSNYKGFSAKIYYEEKAIYSNEISLNYTRTYIHPWKKTTYSVSKSASKLASYDGLPNGASNYYWAKYTFSISGSFSASYPYIGATYYIEDTFPEGCIVLNNNMQLQVLENNKYIDNSFSNSSSNYKTETIYVGYPKSIYNEEAGNLNIINKVDLYVKYNDEEEFSLVDDGEVSLNLANFEFIYTGELYGITKSGYTKQDSENYIYTSSALMYQSIRDNDENNYIKWYINPKIYYTGTPITVHIGDDLIFATNKNGDYEKTNDSDYYYTKISITQIKNMNNQVVPDNKYNCKLWIRYANTNDYIVYEEFTNKRKTWTFTQEQGVVAWYLQIDDMTEGISSFSAIAQMSFIKEDISESGTLYNFAYLKVFAKDSSGNLTLLNTVDESSYANFITKELIASYDLVNHNGYVQRSVDSIPWDYYEIFDFSPNQRINKYNIGSTIQDVENERFLGSFKIEAIFMSTDFDATPSTKVFLEQVTDEDYQTNIILYDLLPKGMDLVSTETEIIESLDKIYYRPVYNKDRQLAFVEEIEFEEFFKEHTSINITKNWNNTGRTLLKITIDFSDYPLLFLGYQEVTEGGTSDYSVSVKYSYDYSISYDSYLENGNTYINHLYSNSTDENIASLEKSSIIDDGSYDFEAKDITNDDDITNKLLHAQSSKTITSIISTHQDVTTFVKTDQNYYSTGTVDSSYNSEYEYKLRVRTGAANVTNLILYTNIEEAQPERTRWKGEFLDVDTTYAENKGYIVKSYYSENPQAGNLYSEDGTLNSDWKEYVSEEQPELHFNGLAITFDKNFKTYNSSDYLYIYYYYNNKLYRSSKYYNTNLAGQTIEIPSTDVYIYWYSSSSGNSAYGFKIDKIKPAVVNTTLGYSGYSLPTNTPIELTKNNYPETSHNPYNNNEQILWHYTYTGSLYQEYKAATDRTKVKSLAFEYLDYEGNTAIIPANSLTYVLIQMKSPIDENIKTLARMDCRTQWNALDEFDQPVDFITGINSNVVKVALPNSINEDNVASISLRFIKDITGTETQFENMKLDINNPQTFMIRLTSLTQNEDGSYNQVTALLKSNQELIISQIPVGTYLLEELGDNYFNFIDFTDNNDTEIIIEGVTLEKTLIGYILTVSENLSETVEFNIKVTNEIEDERFYEDKDNKENLFFKNKIEEDSV